MTDKSTQDLDAASKKMPLEREREQRAKEERKETKKNVGNRSETGAKTNCEKEPSTKKKVRSNNN
jgi:hypothetical protein